MKRFKILGGVVTLFAAVSVFACTDFRLTASDGTVLITRSLEFGLDLQSNLRTSNRNREFKLTGPNDKSGIAWKAKYGYVFLDGLQVDMTVDGLNEKGLSFEALYMPGFAQYQSVPAQGQPFALPYYLIGDWILSNFDSVDEVRQALSKVYVFKQKIPSLGDTFFPLHFSVFEASGKGIVIEYVGGELAVYDHIGVFTNSPIYPWHVTNLKNYANLSPTNPAPTVVNGITYAATGQGFGMLGLPGDVSPPSRFVKTAVLAHVAIPAANALDAVNLAEHIINNVDIPLGLVREPGQDNSTNESTQWVVFKDLTHKVFYYRTYHDLSLRSVSLEKLDFSEKNPRHIMPIKSIESVRDMTVEFLSKDLKY